ncbi:MAG: hypothetical protein ACR2HJ_06115 [Fimbriimonadales bacterium]
MCILRSLWATSTREIYAVEVIRAITSRHGLEGDLELMSDSGMVNEAWLMGGEYVLRIIRATRLG